MAGLIAMRFGIETTMIGGVSGFQIASSRRREIPAWLEKHGLPFSAALIQQAALITRRHKAERDLDELKADLRGRYAECSRPDCLRKPAVIAMVAFKRTRNFL